MKKIIGVCGILLAATLFIAAQTYNVFSPGGDLAGSGSTWNNQVIANGAIPLSGSKVSGTLPVLKGGTGSTALVGVLKGNGTTAVTSAAAADVYGLWGGGCDSSNYLRGDGQCSSPAISLSLASPSTQIGLTQIDGVLATAMRSDAAPALNQAITPTWTGVHTFNSMPNIPNNGVQLSKIQAINTSRFLGRITAGSGDPEQMTGTQATTMLDTFTSGLKGLVPASGGGTTAYLRADGVFAIPSSGAGGSNTQVQYNSSGALAGSSGFTWNAGTSTLAAPTVSTTNVNVAATAGLRIGTRTVTTGAPTTTGTAVTNVSSVAGSFSSEYIKVGLQTQVAMDFTVTSAGAGLTEVEVSVPLGSTQTAAVGVCSMYSASGPVILPGLVKPKPSDNGLAVRVQFIADAAKAYTAYCNYQYGADTAP